MAALLSKWSFWIFLGLVAIWTRSGSTRPTDNVPSNALSKVRCSVEDYNTVRVKENPSNDWYEVGDTVEYVCHDSKGNQEFMLANYPENFFVYPTAFRTCQKDGTWSGSPPVCADKLKVFEAKKPLIINSSYYCKPDDCITQREEWVTAGELHPGCVGILNRSINETDDWEVQEILMKFTHYCHLSYAAFERWTKGPFFVEVKVPQNTLLQTYSNESLDLQKNQYNAVNKVHETPPAGECAIVQLGSYTNEVLVRFFSKKENGYDSVFNPNRFKYQWQPVIQFNTILEIDKSQNQLRNGYGCPMRPSLPNAEVLNETQELVVYTCKEGFTLVDPVTQQMLSTAQIRCSNQFEWIPLRYPTCMKLNDQAEPLLHEPTNNASPTGHEVFGSLTGSQTVSGETRINVSKVQKISSPSANSSKKVIMPIFWLFPCALLVFLF